MTSILHSQPVWSYNRVMKNLVPLVALGLCLAGCAEVVPHDDANAGLAIFQANTAQTPDHIFQCVDDAYRGQGDVNASDLPGGGKKITASLANGAIVEVIRGGISVASSVMSLVVDPSCERYIGASSPPVRAPP